MLTSKNMRSLLTMAVLTHTVVMGQQRLSSEDFKSMIDNGDFYAILDVRTKEEFEAGHIEGATLVENLASFGSLSDQVSTPEDLLGCEECTMGVYCRSGGRAAQAIEILRSAGFRGDLFNGLGTSNWVDAGFELVQTPSIEPACTVDPSVSEECLRGSLANEGPPTEPLDQEASQGESGGDGSEQAPSDPFPFINWGTSASVPEPPIDEIIPETSTPESWSIPGGTWDTNIVGNRVDPVTPVEVTPVESWKIPGGTWDTNSGIGNRDDPEIPTNLPPGTWVAPVISWINPSEETSTPIENRGSETTDTESATTNGWNPQGSTWLTSTSGSGVQGEGDASAPRVEFVLGTNLPSGTETSELQSVDTLAGSTDNAWVQKFWTETNSQPGSAETEEVTGIQPTATHPWSQAGGAWVTSTSVQNNAGPSGTSNSNNSWEQLDQSWSFRNPSTTTSEVEPEQETITPSVGFNTWQLPGNSWDTTTPTTENEDTDLDNNSFTFGGTTSSSSSPAIPSTGTTNEGTASRIPWNGGSSGTWDNASGTNPTSVIGTGSATEGPTTSTSGTTGNSDGTIGTGSSVSGTAGGDDGGFVSRNPWQAGASTWADSSNDAAEPSRISPGSATVPGTDFWSLPSSWGGTASTELAEPSEIGAGNANEPPLVNWRGPPSIVSGSSRIGSESASGSGTWSSTSSREGTFSSAITFLTGQTTSASPAQFCVRLLLSLVCAATLFVI